MNCLMIHSIDILKYYRIKSTHKYWIDRRCENHFEKVRTRHEIKQRVKVLLQRKELKCLAYTNQTVIYQ